jgi:GMP synthase-like glutamine amidotransferase
MKPILIFVHIESSGPGLFETYLRSRTIQYEIIRPNRGEAIPGPGDISYSSGLCFCGGMESVTEPTSWMLDEIRLIQEASKVGKPVIGHCLGGQLICKALGGQVMRQQQEEFGWSRLYKECNQTSSRWLKNTPDELFAMQWHNDSFTIPTGATRILTGSNCINQAFVYGNMLAMQFHMEADRETIRNWATELVENHPRASESVQTGREIMANLENYYPVSKQLAYRLYPVWLEYVG